MQTQKAPAIVGLTIGLSILLAACGGGGSDGGTPTPAAPVVTTQPTDATVLTGDTATFSASATGSDLHYEWRRGGVAIPGATASSYTTPPATYRDNAACYAVVVSNAGGSATSATAQLRLKLSDNQRIYEGLVLGDGQFRLSWNLMLAGPEVAGTNYLASTLSTVDASPLIQGPLTVRGTALRSLVPSLPLPDLGVTRYLNGGAIVLSGGSVVSYVGSDVRTDTLAKDGVTVVQSALRSQFKEVPLSGAVAAAPAEMAQPYNSIFANPDVLDTAQAFAPRAAYVTYKETTVGDQHFVYDCTTPTTGTSPTPCFTGTTLDAALAAGIRSASDDFDYHTADGRIETVGGVRVWIGNSRRPLSSTVSGTPYFRTYFELDGAVYTGSVIKGGSTLANNYFVSNRSGTTVADRLTFFDYQVRLNKAAHDSIASAVKL